MTDRPRTLDDLGWPDDRPDGDPEMNTPPQPEDGIVLTRHEYREFLQILYAQLASYQDFSETQAIAAVRAADELMFGEGE